jgi:hypothetical protein
VKNLHRSEKISIKIKIMGKGGNKEEGRWGEVV